MLNYTIRPVLWKHKANKQGLCPLVVAVTISRKVTYISTPYKLMPAQWNEETKEVQDYPNSRVINASLRKQIADLEKDINTRSLSGEDVTSASLKRTAPKSKSFESFALEIRSTRGDKKECNRLEAFKPYLQLSDIDAAFLRKYEAHERARGMGNNTLNSTFKYIHKILNQAHKEGLIKVNPCDHHQMPKYIQTDRTYLVDAEKKDLLKLLDKDLTEGMRITLTYFLLGCYSGLRHSDWGRFRPDMVQDGLLRLRAKKNSELVVLPVGPTLAGIINRVKELPPPYTQEACNIMLKAIGPMAGIKKKLTTHVARHSFGYMCASNRLPKSVTADLMGISTKVVEVYYHLAGVDIIEQAAVLRTI